MQSGFTQYIEAGKHRPGHANIDRSSRDETHKADVLQATQFLQVNQKMWETQALHSKIPWQIPGQLTWRKQYRVRCMHYNYIQTHRSIIGGIVNSCSHHFYSILIKIWKQVIAIVYKKGWWGLLVYNPQKLLNLQHITMCTSVQPHYKGAHSHHVLGTVLDAQAHMPTIDNTMNSRTAEGKQDWSVLLLGTVLFSDQFRCYRLCKEKMYEAGLSSRDNFPYPLSFSVCLRLKAHTNIKKMRNKRKTERKQISLEP